MLTKVLLRTRITFYSARFKDYVERKVRSIQRHKRVYAIIPEFNEFWWRWP